MQEVDIKFAFANLKEFKQGEYVAPHKALLLLYMLGRCWHCQERMILFREAASPIRELIARFSQSTPSADAPKYPFLALYNLLAGKEHIWELVSVMLADSIKRSAKERPSYRAMMNSDLRGGFSKDLHRRIVHDKFLLLQLAFIVLDKPYFP